MKRFTSKEIQEVFKDKGYRFFKRGLYNVNIIGVRSENSVSNSFDDQLHIIYRDAEKWRHHIFDCTTDPGKYWLQNPLHKKGTLIMVPGQYSGAYKLGIHGRSGKFPYKALEQQKPMQYVRDNNRDAILDRSLYYDSENVFWAICKTNLHRTSKWKAVQLVERYSAGCQVVQSPKDFNFIMNVMDEARYLYGNSFTYTLLEEKDFTNG